MIRKSSDQLLESLSALMDGEASELEVHRVLKSVEGSEDLQKSWERYNLISSAMRREVTSSGVDLSGAIRDAIDAQESGANVAQDHQTEQQGTSRGADRRWLGWLAKSSVAASVAAVFVVGAGYVGNSGLSDLSQASSPTVAVTPSSTTSSSNLSSNTTLSAPLGFELPAVESRTVSASQLSTQAHPLPASSSQSMSVIEAKAFLNQLQLHHARRASLNGGIGLLPFARISEIPDAQDQ